MREIFAFLKFAADMYFCRFFVAKILTSLNISYRMIYSAEFFLFLYIKKFCAVFFFKKISYNVYKYGAIQNIINLRKQSVCK